MNQSFEHMAPKIASLLPASLLQTKAETQVRRDVDDKVYQRTYAGAGVKFVNAFNGSSGGMDIFFDVGVRKFYTEEPFQEDNLTRTFAAISEENKKGVDATFKI